MMTNIGYNNLINRIKELPVEMPHGRKDPTVDDLVMYLCGYQCCQNKIVELIKELSKQPVMR